MNNAVDFAITAGHLAQDRPDRLGVGDIAGMVRGLDPGGLQIRQGLSHLHGPVVGSERLSRRRLGAGWPGLMPGLSGVLPRKTRRGLKGARLRARWAVIPAAPPDMTITSPGLRLRLAGPLKTDGATRPSEVKTLPSRCIISTTG